MPIPGKNREIRGGLTAVDLFCGAGGVTTGFKAAGIKVIAAIDTDETARSSYAVNHPEVLLLDDDVSELQPRKLMRQLGIHRGEMGILTACAPCQSFSSLSKERKSDDHRPRLVQRIADFAEALRPAAIVMENVPQVRTSYHFRRLVARLRRAGYGVWHGVVNAADFGVPQRRRRLVLIGLLGKADQDVPRLVPTAPPIRHMAIVTTVRMVLEDMTAFSADPLHQARGYPKTVMSRIRAIPKDGGGRNDLPDDLQLECHRGLGKSGAGSSYGRMSWDDVAPTLTTRCTTPACGRFLHPQEDRAISAREAALLQTFPPTYRLEGRSLSIQAQIGNAVPPRLAEAMGLLVVDALADAAQKRAVPTIARAAAS